MELKKKFINIAGRFFKDNNKGLIKKILLGAGALFAVCSLAFIGLFIALIIWTANILSARPDADLVALESLIAAKEIVLSPDQRQAITPLIDALAGDDLSPDQQGALKKQLWEILEEPQRQAVEQLKEELSRKAQDVFLPFREMLAMAGKYVGITPELIEKKTEGLIAWWKLKKPGNSAEELRRTMENQ